jgi:dTDP-4-amino-4,6-dideoxygalactose transaminase
MCAILSNIKPGDEVIVPSYTFVSTALAFTREGAKLVFADSRKDSPNIDEDKIEDLITPRTKALAVVHYAGIACDMDKIKTIAEKHNLIVIEDAAQDIDSYYNGKPLGTIGNLGVLSFHETKNIQCGEGGLISINEKDLEDRSEIIWEKGTNRSKFLKGEINKYGWEDIGSSFLPADYVAAYLWAQLENLDSIQRRRKEIWERYYSNLSEINKRLPVIPNYATNNAHMFYMICDTGEQRDRLMNNLKDKGINTCFHYLCLHKSNFIKNRQPDTYKLDLPMAEHYEKCLLRLPLYPDLPDDSVDYICEAILNFYKQEE